MTFSNMENHFVRLRRCILSHLRHSLELVQSPYHLLLTSQHQLVCNVLNLPFLHWIFKLKCLLTFYFSQVIMCWHVRILADAYWHLMEMRISLTRFFILFFKTKDLGVKNSNLALPRS